MLEAAGLVVSEAAGLVVAVAAFGVVGQYARLVLETRLEKGSRLVQCSAGTPASMADHSDSCTAEWLLWRAGQVRLGHVGERDKMFPRSAGTAGHAAALPRWRHQAAIACPSPTAESPKQQHEHQAHPLGERLPVKTVMTSCDTAHSNS